MYGNFYGNYSNYGTPNFNNSTSTYPIANTTHNSNFNPQSAPTQMSNSMITANQGMATQLTQPQQSPQDLLQQSVYKIRPVTSIDEARAAAIDLDAKINIFTDFNNGYIYVKSINMSDGTANLQSYKLQPVGAVEQQQYVTNKDFELVVNKVLQLEQGFNKIQKEWGTLNDESTTTSTTK